MLAGRIYGSAVRRLPTTSILMRIPGEASSVMTRIDGYAMARRGGAAHYISADRLCDRGHLRHHHADPAGTANGHSLALRFGPPEYTALLDARPDLHRLYVVVSGEHPARWRRSACCWA